MSTNINRDKILMQITHPKITYAILFIFSFIRRKAHFHLTSSCLRIIHTYCHFATVFLHFFQFFCLGLLERRWLHSTQKRGAIPCVYSQASRGNDTMGFRPRCICGGRGAICILNLQLILKAPILQ